VFLGLNFQRWVKDPYRRLMLYDVSLYFLLPGLMSLVSLLAVGVPGICRVAFAIADVIGAVMFLATAEEAAGAQAAGEDQDGPAVALDRRLPRGSAGARPQPKHAPTAVVAASMARRVTEVTPPSPTDWRRGGRVGLVLQRDRGARLLN
jgi:hypothetical protein